MGQFNFIKTEIEGVFIIEPRVFIDERGYFMETYNKADFHKAGITCEFVQDNQSKSKKGVLRGLHFQKQYPQAKLVRVTKGEVYDVAVDLRKDSPTYGKYVGVILSAEKKNMLFIPRGFAHGFLVLSEEAEFIYKCDEFYHPEDEGGIRWDDQSIGIRWPEVGIEYCLSEKDKILAKLLSNRNNIK
ncbi:MAG: dTDP-4-dehydrorhamnose 3,5-epimerase [Tissierellia bacterium]|nr:dTDP-4-dehydrorhamnose 3,5-epimerase [Tissierellia bacterium]